MRQRVRAAGKTAVRRVVRARGYDLVPMTVGFAETQRRVLAGCDRVIDVGANVGQFAERVRDLGVALPVVSFEPGAVAYSILERKAERDPGWTVRNVALDEQPGRRVLRVAANSVSSSLLDVTPSHVHGDPRSAEASREEVQVSTLDDELDGVDGSALYLKIDVQGLELPVLRGAERTLARTAAVQVEVSFTELYDGEAGWLELCRFLEEHGLVVRSLEPGFEDAEAGAVLQCDLLLCRRAPLEAA